MRVGAGSAPALAAVVVVNLLAAAQARVNADLGAHLHDPLAAALVSTGVGFLVVSAVVSARPGLRAGLGRLSAAVREGRLPRRTCLGGVCGGFFVAGQAATVPRLGVATFTVAVVAGTSAGSLVGDARGWGGVPRRSVTARRVLGAALVLAAVVLAGRDHLDGARGAWYVVVPVLGGIAIAWQTAANGVVRARSQSAAAATWLNFALAAGSLLPVVVLERAVRADGADALLPSGWPTTAWSYAGGVLGLALILAATRLVARTGVLLFGLAAVAGQVCGALVLDAATAPQALDVAGVVAAVVTLAGVAVAAGTPRRRADVDPPGPRHEGEARPPFGPRDDAAAGPQRR
ncbi:MAG: DMT family transporter [Kineosporiaceae bacterium]